MASTHHHGNSPAAWTGVLVSLIGFLVGSVGLMLNPINFVVMWVGIVLAAAGLGVFSVMAKLGHN